MSAHYTEDLVDREDISEGAILNELRDRFLEDVIYSSIGPIIIAINPYKTINRLFAYENMERVMANGVGILSSVNPSHVWSIALSACTQLDLTGKRQAIVISGESGAGKTEAAKKSLQFISAIVMKSSKAQSLNVLRRRSSVGAEAVEDRVQATNPVLESFGNAKTARNNNSSRFGKWVEIQFLRRSGRDKLVLEGARITQYLLEKTRVVVQSEEERNFHIFYQLCSDSTMGLERADHYRFLNQSGIISIDGVDDAEEFKMTRKSMTDLGFPDEDRDVIFNALKSILFLGNIDFEEKSGKGEESVQRTDVTATEDTMGLARQVADLLGFTLEKLLYCLTTRSMTVRGETTHIPLDSFASQDTRNSLAKEIYGRLFQHVVLQANISLQPTANVSYSSGHSDAIRPGDLAIGLLDIFGFEKFAVNSFEQLCINYANEKLQQYFINYVLRKEQNLYKREDIDVSLANVVDNDDVLHLIEGKPTGVFARLDDELKIPRSSDETFLKKLETHNTTSQTRFKKEIKMGRTEFEIRHFAGVIRYDASGFLEKNKDKLSEHLEELLTTSSNTRFAEIMQEREEVQSVSSPDVKFSPGRKTSVVMRRTSQIAMKQSNSGSNFSSALGGTIASRFQGQLQQLMTVLDNSQPHFIKCIKPNNRKVANHFDQEMILQQLRYSGVLEAIQIRKSGYPVQRSFYEFARQYWMLPMSISMRDIVHLSDQERCHEILGRLLTQYSPLLGDIQIGRTLVFLRPSALKLLEKVRFDRGFPAVLFTQKEARRRIAQKTFRRILSALNELKISVEEGNLHQQSNVEAIPRLEQALTVCRIQLHFPEHFLCEADTLLVRLKKVQESLEKFRDFLDPRNKRVFSDVLAEYDALASLLFSAEELEIEAPAMRLLSERRNLLAERAQSLRKLRETVLEFDEHGMAEALQEVQVLNDRNGETFCEKDEAKAETVLAMVKFDNEIIGTAVQELDSFQSGLKLQLQWQSHRLDPKRDKEEKDHFSNWLHQQQEHLHIKLKKLFLAYEKRQPASHLSRHALDAMQSILHLHQLWAQQEWSQISVVATQITEASREVTAGNSQLNSPNPVLERFCRVANAEVEVVKSDVCVHYVLPLLLRAVKTGKVEGVPDDVVVEAVDYEYLVDNLSEARQFVWCGEEMERLLYKMEKLVSVRINFLEEKWDDLLNELDSPTQYEARVNGVKALRDKLDHLENPDRNVENNSSPPTTKDSSETDHLLVWTTGPTPNVFDPVNAEVRDELLSIRSFALDRVIQREFQRALVVGSAEGDVGEVRVEKISTEPLEAALLLLQNLMEAEKRGYPEDPALKKSGPHFSGDTTMLLEAMEMVKELRKRFVANDFDQIISQWQAKQLTLLQVELEMAGESGVLEGFTVLREEMMRLVLEAINTSGVSTMLSAITHNGFHNELTSHEDKASPEDVNIIRESWKQLEELASRQDEISKSAKTEGLGSCTEEFSSLLDIVRCLSVARKTYFSVDDAFETQLQTRKQVLETLYRSCDRYAIPSELEEELLAMKQGIKFSECVAVLKKALKPKSIPVQYLIPLVQQPKRSSQSSAPPRTSSSLLTTTSDDIADILEEEDLMVNEEALDFKELEEAIEYTEELSEEVPEEKWPASLDDYYQAAKKIKLMRQSVLEGDWSSALLAYNGMQEEKLVQRLSEIEEEVLGSSEAINNYAMVAACKSALSRGKAGGVLGNPDFKGISLTSLEEAAHICQATGCTTNRSKALFQAVLVVTDLRTAQKSGDWGAIRSALVRAEIEGIGEGLTSMCYEEITRAREENTIHEVTEALKKSIMNEELSSKDSLLNAENVSVSELNESYNASVQVPEDKRGLILKGLIALAGSILTLRKAVAAKQWNVTEQLISLLKELEEDLETQVEKVERKGPRKTVARASSTFRNSVFSMKRSSTVLMEETPANRVPQPSILLGGSDSGGPLYEEYSDLFQTVNREINTVETHFKVAELEESLLKALQEGGIQCSSIGVIEKNLIRLDDLEAAIQVKNGLEKRSCSLPVNIRNMSKLAHVVLDIRKAVLADDWGSMNTLLEVLVEDDFGSLPDATRAELQAVRWEKENKSIIADLTKALQDGRLEGELGNTNLSKVSYENLQSSLTMAKNLHPRTEQALLLVRTVEDMLPLRKMLCQPATSTIDWQAVSKFANSLMLEVKRQKIHTIVLPELRLIQATAEDTILCKAMSAALESGGAGGVPGDIDLKVVTVKDLVAVGKLCIRSPLKTKTAENLFNTCRMVQRLREALLRTLNCRDVESETKEWSSVRAHVGMIVETRQKHHEDTSWDLCYDEVSLISKHALIQELRTYLLECIIRASHVYHKRNSMNVSFEQSKEVDPNDPESDLLCTELTNIIDFGIGFDFDSDILTQYIACATTLKDLRMKVVEETWVPLKKLLQDPSIREKLQIIPEAIQEVAWITCEYHNHSVMETILSALKLTEDSHSSEDWKHHVIHETNYSQHNHILEQALEEVKSYKVTARAALQLVECCENVLQLRRSLESKDHTQVAQSLRWFRENEHFCPKHIQQEAERAFVMHQNDMLLKGLTKALQTGKPVGPRGKLEVGRIEVSALKTLLDRAKDVEPQLDEVKELLSAAEISYSIRSALRERDLSSVSLIMERLATENNFNLMIVDEIAIARAELDNDIAVTALLEALKSFDDTEGKPLDLSFLQATEAPGEETPDVTRTEKPMKQPGQSILHSFTNRRYSFANKSNANIDPDTIDTEILENGLAIAKSHGIYSSKARKLFRTVSLILALRVEMKASDWPKVEDTLTAADFDRGVGEYYDRAACKEIQAIKSQLELRASIVDLSKCLKQGWARCSNGIVDTSTLNNIVLAEAIERAERGMAELGHGSTTEKQTIPSFKPEVEVGNRVRKIDAKHGKKRVQFRLEEEALKKPSIYPDSPIQKQVELLLESARLVLHTRELLLGGKVEAAGKLAMESLAESSLHYSVIDELKLYSKEINAALAIIKVFDSLREGMLRGDITRLGALIQEAKRLDFHYTRDLGLVRLLDQAETLFASLRETKVQCSALAKKFNIAEITATIEKAEKLNMNAVVLEYPKRRLQTLKTFEEILKRLKLQYHGIICRRGGLKELIVEAHRLKLSDHPEAKCAQLLQKLSSGAFRSAVVAEATKLKNAYIAATETIPIKRAYLRIPSSTQKYRLENFRALRKPEDFGVRMNVISEELRRTMLFHSHQPLPTSLTLQSPVVAALSVWVYSHYVRGIERNMYSSPEVVLRKVVRLGRLYTPMRDELLLQMVKQIRRNTDIEATSRLWKMLCCCLYHFPPSRSFESYLELFLIECSDVPGLFQCNAQQCIRFMHQGIFLYGYDVKIISPFKDSLRDLALWTTDEHCRKAAKLDLQANHNLSVKNTNTDPSTEQNNKVEEEHGRNSIEEAVDPAFLSAVTAGIGTTAPNDAAAKDYAVGVAAEIRGTRENWIARFKLFSNLPTKDGGHVDKSQFSSTLATSLTAESAMDPIDRHVFYFLLFGKHISNWSAIVREYTSAEEVFHSTNDEKASYTARLKWLDDRISLPERSSELFFSQLKPSDMQLYAERFWDNTVERMAVQCLHFPFLHWEMGKHKSHQAAHNPGALSRPTSPPPGEDASRRARRESSLQQTSSFLRQDREPKAMEVAIGWELYREIVLTGMKKFLQQETNIRNQQQTGSSSNNTDSFQLSRFKMRVGLN